LEIIYEFRGRPPSGGRSRAFASGTGETATTSLPARAVRTFVFEKRREELRARGGETPEPKRNCSSRAGRPDREQFIFASSTSAPATSCSDLIGDIHFCRQNPPRGYRSIPQRSRLNHLLARKLIEQGQSNRQACVYSTATPHGTARRIQRILRTATRCSWSTASSRSPGREARAICIRTSVNTSFFQGPLPARRSCRAF